MLFFHRRAPIKYAATTRIATPNAAPIPIPAFAPPLSPEFTGRGVTEGVGEMLDVDVKVSMAEGISVGKISVVARLRVEVVDERVMVGVVFGVALRDEEDEVGFRDDEDDVRDGVALRDGVDEDERPISD